MTGRGTRPTSPQRWPRGQEQRRREVIQDADAIIELIDAALARLERRDHPALTKLDLGDAKFIALRIKCTMVEAKQGTLPKEDDE